MFPAVQSRNDINDAILATAARLLGEPAATVAPIGVLVRTFG